VRAELRAFFEPPAEVTITDTAGEVVFSDKDGGLSIVHPDGRKTKTDSGSEVVARRDAQALVVERTTASGAKLTETYTLLSAAGGNGERTLQVSAQLDNPRRGQPVTVRRIYVAATAQDPASGR
jgi:hypothetical protein